MQQKLLSGSDFCSEINELLFRCISPLNACMKKEQVSKVATALLHDVVPLDQPKLFVKINHGYNCSEIAKGYAAKKAQPQLKSNICK